MSLSQAEADLGPRDAFVEELDLEVLGFARAAPSATGRLVCHPAALLKVYIYG